MSNKRFSSSPVGAWQRFALTVLLALSAWGVSSHFAAGVTLYDARFVLNRSLFLLWDQYGGAGFQRYELHRSTSAGFTPGPATLFYQATTSSRTYYEARGLSPNTPYYFVLRTVTTTGNVDSAQVAATTLADGTDTKFPIIMFHHIQPRSQFPGGYDNGGWYSTEQFTELLNFFATRNMHGITHREYVEWRYSGVPLPPNPVMLTFDDGWKTFYDNAAPLLLANNCRGVNYILTRLMGQNFGSPDWPSMPLMTWNQALWCYKNGLWLGSHTCSHADLRHDKSKLWEIAASKDDIIGQTGQHPEFFCYPWGLGYSDGDVLSAVANASYTAATRTYNSYDMKADAGCNRYQLPRIFPFASDTLYALVARMNIDTDKDGLANHTEMSWGLRDDLADSDGDGLSDWQEVAYDGNTSTYNPYNATNNPSGGDLNAKNPDTDGDGLTDGAEVLTYGTNPRMGDTDGDGMPDGFETVNGTNPKVRDAQRPFVAAPDLPAVIEAENFDYGGQGDAYNDTTTANEGGAYRPAEGVDIAATGTASNGHVVGWTKAGEWYEYTINVQTAAVFDLGLRVACQGAGGTFRVRVDGFDVTGLLTVPNTGNWFGWAWINRPGLMLGAGQHVLRLAMEANGASGYVGNFDVMRFVLGQQPVPAAVPGAFEAEDYDLGGEGAAYHDTTAANDGGAYRLTEGVDIAASAGASNGHVVGWVKAGEWLHYAIHVQSGGLYSISARVASSGAGGTFRMLVDSIDVTGLITVPNTGGWGNWANVTRAGVNLLAGVHVLRVAMNANGPGGFVGNFDRFSISSSTPLGLPSLPGVLQAEDYDLGGEGVAYHDTTAANDGGAYRPAEGVDIAADPGAGNGALVGWAKAGEWIRYTVNVTTTAMYDLSVRVASPAEGGTFNVTVDGADVTGALAVPNTGGWLTWSSVDKSGIALSLGTHTVRVVMASNGASGFVGNFDQLQFTLAPVFPAIPGTIEAENFDDGGEGTGYHDTTAANEGGQYRPAEGVDIAASGTAGNGFLVGWAKAGEWLRYTVNVAASASYDLSVRVASSGAGGTFRVTVDGADVTGVLGVPNTGGWYTWANVMKTGIGLSAGIHTVRVAMVSNGGGGYVGNFDWLVFTQVPPPLRSLAPTRHAVSSRISGSLVRPLDVVTSDDTPESKPGWAAVDGDTNTAWVGRSDAGGWWMVLVYDPALSVTGVVTDMGPLSPTNVISLWSNDADQWNDLPSALKDGPVMLDYLWLIFGDDGSGHAPVVREVQPASP